MLFKHKKTIRLLFLQIEFPMGLDKTQKKVLNRVMSIKLLLRQMGLGSKLGENSKSRVSPLVRERQRFEEEVRKQFMELKKKGISIPVFTL